jgi:thioredoxin 1
MGDADDIDDIDDIRAQKKEELMNRLDSPETPIRVEGEGHLTDLLRDHRLLLVDFYADWCGPCEMLEPTVEAVAEETRAAVAKVDIDAHRAIARQYQVRGVPTLILIVDGEPADRMDGVQNKGSLLDAIDAHA